MNMSLTELQALIKGSHLPDYYQQLLIHHEAIIKYTNEHSQADTAKVLVMSVGKFSTIYKMILAHYMIVKKS